MTPLRAAQIAIRILPWLLLVIGIWLVSSEVSRPSFLIRAGDVKARIGCLAFVMTAIIISGGIDLSIGSMIALCSVVMAVLWDAGFPPGVAALGAVGSGLLAGAGNGLLVNMGLSPLVATLATMAFFRGLAVTIAGGRTFSFGEQLWGLDSIFGWPAEYLLMVLLFIVAWVIVHHTPMGRWCFAVGDSATAARYAAVPTVKLQYWLYVASGLVASLLAVIYTARKGANPEEHAGIELEVIACVVVGGTLITGGRGSVLLTLLGVMVVSSLDIGLFLLNSRFSIFPAEARLMMIGLLLIIVAVTNQWLARSYERQIKT